MTHFDQLPALTLWQPWATMIAVGAKRIETRHWKTNYRGWLVIHAAKRFQIAEKELCLHSPFCEMLKCAGILRLTDMPLGAGLCAAYLVEVTPTETLTEGTALVDFDEVERALGNYQPRRYAWIFDRVLAFPAPIVLSGRQGIWNWPWPIETDELREVARYRFNERSAEALNLDGPD